MVIGLQIWKKHCQGIIFYLQVWYRKFRYFKFYLTPYCPNTLNAFSQPYAKHLNKDCHQQRQYKPSLQYNIILNLHGTLEQHDLEWKNPGIYLQDVWWELNMKTLLLVYITYLLDHWCICLNWLQSNPGHTLLRWPHIKGNITLISFAYQCTRGML